MKVFKVPQVSPEWWQIRRGVPTASEFNRIITAVKGDLSAQADDFIAELIADMACQNPNYFTEKGTPVNSYAIQNGKDMEPEARRWLAMDANLDVHEVGFCMTDDLRLGCSPDGLIGLKVEDKPEGEWNGVPYYAATAEASLELKCPLLKTHTKYLLDGRLPQDYKPQCHGQLLVCGVKRVEFVSYSSALAPLRVTVEADEYTVKLAKALDSFKEKYEAASARILGGR